ncbi:MAG: hypothetical protein Q7S57_05145 [bacterium]|nr:hypothetical protein [bacterium]
MLEGSPRTEQYKNSREKLLALEDEGKYVFHGSPNNIELLEPRQGYNFNEITGEQEKDGNPAVFATQYANLAIFRALINDKNIKEESSCRSGVDDAGLHFTASRNLLDYAKTITAKIYVLDKNSFSNFDHIQGRSEQPVTPLEVIEVTAEDLPENITVIE